MALPALTDTPWVPDDSTFGARLALVRWRLGWNVKEAADACGLNDQSWRNWESGKLPRDLLAVSAKIAGTTGCSEMWLVSGNQNWKQMTTSDLRVLDGGGMERRGRRADTHPGQLAFRHLSSVPT